MSKKYNDYDDYDFFDSNDNQQRQKKQSNNQKRKQTTYDEYDEYVEVKKPAQRSNQNRPSRPSSPNAQRKAPVKGSANGNKKTNQKGKKGKKKNSKNAVIISAVALILVVVLGIIAWIFFGGKGTTAELNEVKKIGEVINIVDEKEGINLEVRITKIEVLDQIGETILKGNIKFACIEFEYVNKGKTTVEWRQFPLSSLSVFNSAKPGSADYISGYDEIDKDALKDYSLLDGMDLNAALEPLGAGEVRYDADVFRIKASSLSKTNHCFIMFDLAPGIGVEITLDGGKADPTVIELPTEGTGEGETTNAQ